MWAWWNCTCNVKLHVEGMRCEGRITKWPWMRMYWFTTVNRWSWMQLKNNLISVSISPSPASPVSVCCRFICVGEHWYGGWLTLLNTARAEPAPCCFPSQFTWLWYKNRFSLVPWSHMNHSTLPVRAAPPLSSVPPPTAIYQAEGIKFKPVTFSSGRFFPIQDDARSDIFTDSPTHLTIQGKC